MNTIIQIVLPLALAFIMFSMGLDLTLNDFKRIGKFPKAFILGFVLQFVSLPVLAFGLAAVFMKFGLAPEYAVGLVIIATCPGGVTSNMMTHLAQGDAALSIALTAVTSVVSVLTLPFLINLGLSTFMGAQNAVVLPIGKTIIGIFCITTVPVAIGMLIKHYKNKLATHWEPMARKLAAIFFVVIVMAAILKDWALIAENILTIGPMALLLNSLTMLVAFGASRLAKLDQSQTTAITYECGFQNGTLAIFITLTLLQNEKMMIPGGIYSILMFATALIYFLILRKTNQRLQTDA